MAATAISMMATMSGAFSQAQAAKAQGEFEKQQAEINARFADMKAKEAIRIGDRSAAQHGRKIKSLVGKQRASLAAQGIQVDTGTAEEIQEQTLEIGREEMEIIRNNAWREAFGYKSQAAGDRMSGQMAESAGRFQATGTLISGGLKAMDTYSRSSQLQSSTKFEAPKSANVAMTWDPAKVRGES